VDLSLFDHDVADRPRALRALADQIDGGDDPWSGVPLVGVRRVVMSGMGSSRFAALIAAHRLERAGIIASAEHASAPSARPDSTTLFVAISASGSSPEVLRAADEHRGRSRLVGMTNTPDSALSGAVDHVVDIAAGKERSGVACRSYTQTIALLLLLEHRLSGSLPDLAARLRTAAMSTEHLLATKDGWLPPLASALDGPDGVWFSAPAGRLGSAHQAALMVREIPRRSAVGCETGDWSHIDVYLTKTLDYRLAVFGGSPWESELRRWTTERNSTVAWIGPGSASSVDVVIPGGDDEVVAALVEITVAELVAQRWWFAGASG
jgi:glucosamine--fructose-6-phosphate aminotransferase (isomerizing)